MNITRARLLLIIAVTIVVTTTVVVTVVHREDDAAREAADKRMTEFHPVPETSNDGDTLELNELARPKPNTPEHHN